MTQSWLVLSPHSDDAALSVGAWMALRRAAGDTVHVLTCFGGSGAAPPASPVATRLHRAWGVRDAVDATATRAAEDREAWARLGVTGEALAFPERLYRQPTVREPSQLFRAPEAGDALADALAAAIAAHAVGRRVVAPLGVGGHTDHLLVHRAAGACAEALWFYEDLPYAARPGTLERRLADLRVPLAATAENVEPTFEAKLHAVMAYRSQIGPLFGSPDALVATLTAYAADVAPPGALVGERLWRTAQASATRT